VLGLGKVLPNVTFPTPFRPTPSSSSSSSSEEVGGEEWEWEDMVWLDGWGVASHFPRTEITQEYKIGKTQQRRGGGERRVDPLHLHKHTRDRHTEMLKGKYTKNNTKKKKQREAEAASKGKKKV
jgi:hypothetical protein